MEKKVAQFIRTNRLLCDSSKILVALSGGADSVALLIALYNLGYSCSAVHCNFHLRGEESMRDEMFVRSLCERMNIELKVFDFDTEKYARDEKLSIEMAARELRYNVFEKERIAQNADVIAVAHHRDDCAETLLLNLMRGTGIRGLHGILPHNGYIIRPLLCVCRDEITQYLSSKDESFVTDSTNLTDDYTRNKVRLKLLPLMEEINPSIKQTLYETALRLSQAELIYDDAIKVATKRVKKNNRIDIGKLLKEPSPQTLLFEILSPLGFNGAQCEEIVNALDKESGRYFVSSEWVVVKDREELIIEKNSALSQIEIRLPASGVVDIENYGSLTLDTFLFNGEIIKSRNSASLDAEQLSMPLLVRNVRKGDRFAPFGMRGTKLVSDYLTDAKRSLIEKQKQLVVVDANGDIVWLVGERPAAPFCITKETKKILRLMWKRI